MKSNDFIVVTWSKLLYNLAVNMAKEKIKSSFRDPSGYLFEENGILDDGVGSRFRDEILAPGGSRPALESFIAFRGREPTIDALLRHNEMASDEMASNEMASDEIAGDEISGDEMSRDEKADNGSVDDSTIAKV